MTPASIATFIAVLNGVNVVVISAGWLLIRRERKLAHAGCMLLAFTISVVYSALCATQYFRIASTFARVAHPLHTFLLISHLAFGLAVIPMVAASMIPAFRAHWQLHRRIANFTIPVWLYVAISGTIIGLLQA